MPIMIREAGPLVATIAVTRAARIRDLREEGILVEAAVEEETEG